MTGTHSRLHLPKHLEDRRVSRLNVKTAARAQAFQFAYVPVPVARMRFPSRPSNDDATVTPRVGERACAAIAKPRPRNATAAAITVAPGRNLDARD